MIKPNNNHIDNEGNKYYLLVLKDDNTWQAINHPFLIMQNEDGKLIGQFISSIWYNERIPNRDHHIIIVKINAAKIQETLSTLLSDMNKIILENRLENNPYIIIHHVFTKSMLDEMCGRLRTDTQIIEHYSKTLECGEIFMDFLGHKIENIFYSSMYCPGFVLNI